MVEIEEKKIYLKFLTERRISPVAYNFYWSLPTDNSPGEWAAPIKGALVPCENGYHLCDFNPERIDILLHNSEFCYLAEYEQGNDDFALDYGDKFLARRVRLIK